MQDPITIGCSLIALCIVCIQIGIHLSEKDKQIKILVPNNFGIKDCLDIFKKSKRAKEIFNQINSDNINEILDNSGLSNLEKLSVFIKYYKSIKEN